MGSISNIEPRSPIRRTGTPDLNLLMRAVEMACSVRYQHDMSTRTVSALIFWTSTLVTLSIAEKYICSAADAVEAAPLAAASVAAKASRRDRRPAVVT